MTDSSSSELVVGREHGGVLGGDVDAVARVAQRGDRLDVVPVAMGLDDLTDAEALAQLEQQVVLVGGIDEHGVARLRAPQDEDVVLVRTDHDLVDLGLLVGPVEGVGGCSRHGAQPAGSSARRVAGRRHRSVTVMARRER